MLSRVGRDVSTFIGRDTSETPVQRKNSSPVSALVRVLIPLLVGAVAGCTSAPARRPAPTSPAPAERPAVPAESQTPAPSRGGYYLDDGPGDQIPPNLEKTPDAIVRPESVHPYANQPYVVMGVRYVPLGQDAPYRARGVASWYGRKFHGKQTAVGETYDMFQMTAAHPLLPIPSYVRVTNLANGRSVVVRVNDRGPFLRERIIDLSYTAALKLGFADRGSAEVEVQALRPGPEPPPTLSPTALLKSPGDHGTANGSLFLQLGAFAGKASADSFRNYVTKEFTALREAARVFFKEGLFRVHAGPYATEREAKAMASRIERALGLTPVLVR
jgi:rare lipoprotein A